MEDDHKTKKHFENFFSRTGLIRQDNIKYYVYWVIKFLNYCNYRPIKPFNQNISPYLEQLEKDERIKEWQVTYTCPHCQPSGFSAQLIASAPILRCLG